MHCPSRPQGGACGCAPLRNHCLDPAPTVSAGTHTLRLIPPAICIPTPERGYKRRCGQG